MDWIVKKVGNIDAERQHLNKILAEIKAAINAAGSGTSTTNVIERTNTRYAVGRFTFTLDGDVTGSAEIDGLDDVTLTTTIGDLPYVEEAPLDAQAYWRSGGEWEAVSDALTDLESIEGNGFTVIYEDVDHERRWITREIEGTTNNIVVTDGTGVDGNPVIDLAVVVDSNTGTLQGITVDGFGRVTGTTDGTITGTLNRISVVNGNAAAGVPTIDIDAAYVGQTSITTLGTIGTGVWQGTVVGLTYGGTGANYSSVAQNLVFASPNGSAGAPVFRALVAADIPSLSGIYQPLDTDLTVISGLTPSNDDFMQYKAGAWSNRTVAQVKTDLSLSGTNSGDQTSIVGITGTLAEFNTALTGADFASGGGTATGTNTGDQTITLTGDVTGTGTGTFATTLATAQPGAHTWAAVQTFTLAPVFTDASGTRTALGLGTAALKNIGTSGNTVPVLDASNTWGSLTTQTFDGSVVVGLSISAGPSSFESIDILRPGFVPTLTLQSSATTLRTDINLLNNLGGGWRISKNDNAGNDFYIEAFDNTATSLGNALEIIRSTRVVNFPVAPTFADAATTLTNLGATAVGSALVTIPDPSAIRFIRINADNTVTALSPASTRGALGLGTVSTEDTGTSGHTIPFLDGTNTWANTQTLTLAPVFTDQSGSRTALGLGTAAVKNTGTSGNTIPLLDGTNTWTNAQTFSTAITAPSGGTGQSSYAVGDLLYASTTTALSKLAAVATGRVLRSAGTSTAPAWGLDAQGVAAITAASGNINTTETNVISYTVPADQLVAGQTYRVTVSGICTSTAANASNFRIRVGTANTNADAIAAVVTPTAAASGANIPFSATFVITLRVAGASGTMVGSGVLTNNGVTGVSAAAVVVGQVSTSITVNTTVQNFIHLMYVSAAATTTCNFIQATIELVKP